MHCSPLPNVMKDTCHGVQITPQEFGLLTEAEYGSVVSSLPSEIKRLPIKLPFNGLNAISIRWTTPCRA